MAKKRKNDIHRLKDELIRRRNTLLEQFDASMEQGYVTTAPDENDVASFAAEGDLALSLATMESATLNEIDRALKRIDSGEYGRCKACAKPINPERLKALPYATLCIECKQLEEQGML
jgi:DnaK suppressor protein